MGANMATNYQWIEVWALYDGFQEPHLKEHIEKEILDGDWLYRQSAQEQAKILEHAPKDFVQRIADRLKPEVQIKLGINPYLKETK